MRALGLLVRLLCRPDNWQTNSETLAREFECGREQIRGVLRELSQAGYMKLRKTQSDNGHWSSAWHVFDKPLRVDEQPDQAKPEAGKPEPGKPEPGKPYFGELGAITRTDLTRTDNKNPPTPQGGAPDGAGGVEPTFPDDLADLTPIETSPSAGSACTTAGSVCLAMKAAGIADTNPGNPKLRALVDAGADLQEFVGAAQQAVSAGNGRFAYVLGIVEGGRKRAAAMASQLHQGAMPAAETAYQRSMRERVQEFAPSLARTATAAQQPRQSAVEFFNAIEVPARTVGALK